MTRGNLVGNNNIPTATTARGIWNLREHYQANVKGIWPGSVIRSGLVMHVDAGNPASYSGSGSTWNDLTGTVSAGTLYNSPTYNSANGGYFSFNGSNQYATFPNSTALDNQSFTVEVWLKTNATSQYGSWFGKGSVNNQYDFFQEGSAIRFRIMGSDYVSPDTGTYLNTTSWYQMVGTLTTGALRIYANGTVIGSASPSVTMTSNANGMSIGAYGGVSGNGYVFNGSIAICRVYNRALSQTEVQANFAAQKARFGLS